MTTLATITVAALAIAGVAAAALYGWRHIRPTYRPDGAHVDRVRVDELRAAHDAEVADLTRRAVAAENVAARWRREHARLLGILTARGDATVRHDASGVRS